MCNASNFYFLVAWLLCSFFVPLCKVLGSWLWGCAGAEQALGLLLPSIALSCPGCDTVSLTDTQMGSHRKGFLTVLRPVPHTPGTLYYYHLCFITSSFAKPFGTTQLPSRFSRHGITSICIFVLSLHFHGGLISAVI